MHIQAEQNSDEHTISEQCLTAKALDEAIGRTRLRLQV